MEVRQSGHSKEELKDNDHDDTIGFSSENKPSHDVASSLIEDKTFQLKPIDSFRQPKESEDIKKSRSSPSSSESTLVCPNNPEAATEVQYWRSKPSSWDAEWESPFNPTKETRYVTFESDPGGWNNIRMQMEMIVVFALVTGRTLVLPPEQVLYLLNKNKDPTSSKKKHTNNEHSFSDFFPIDLWKDRLDIITMDEFLDKETQAGGLLANDPPSSTRLRKKKLWEYIREHGVYPKVKPSRGFITFPKSYTKPSSPLDPGYNYTHIDKAVRTDAEREEYKAFQAGRGAYVLPPSINEAPIIHFPSGKIDNQQVRWLTHFYAFLHFVDPKVDHMTKRFVRDYIRYVDEIFCVAANVIREVRKESPSGGYKAYHVRMGDFQYKEVKLPNDELLANTKHLLKEGETIYIATDQKDLDFFAPMRSKYNVKFLWDYMEGDKADCCGLKELNPNYLGMVDAVIASKADLFVGTWFSTFTGYITRLRGYYGMPKTSTFYGTLRHREQFHLDERPRFPFYMREWEVAWKDIDDDIIA